MACRPQTSFARPPSTLLPETYAIAGYPTRRNWCDPGERKDLARDGITGYTSERNPTWRIGTSLASHAFHPSKRIPTDGRDPLAVWLGGVLEEDSDQQESTWGRGSFAMQMTVVLPSELSDRDVSDRDLEQRIATSLADRHLPGLRQLEVAAKDGTVTLRGRVRSFYEKQMCQNVCRRMNGVVQFVDAIVVA